MKTPRLLHSLNWRRALGTTCLLMLSLSVIAVHRSSAAAVNLKDTPVPVEVTNPVQVSGTVEVKGPIEVQGAVEIVNDALKTPYYDFVSGSIAPGVGNALLQLNAVPAGKRLVIEAITAQARVPAGQSARGFLSLVPKSLGAGGTVYLTFQPQGTFADGATFTATHPLTIRVDPAKQSLQVNIERGGSVGSASVSFTLVGYLED